VICLQGGAEFGPECRAMDADLLRRAGGGPAVVVPLAGAPGREHDTAGASGVRHLRALGGTATVAPDARHDPAGALAAVRSARLVFLPGGSPRRLLEALRSTGLADVLPGLVEDGVVLVGASAGAMVLCGWTVLPDRRGPHGVAVEPALGLVPDALVLPHWSGGSSRGDWLRAVEATVPEGLRLLGVPEQSGVLVTADGLVAVGRSGTELVGTGEVLPVG
jgi:cyanophycinase-like exopeptidase